MLANGITLKYKEKTGSGEFKVLTALTETPEWGSEPEKVDMTDLSDTIKVYELGVGDSPEVEYKFLVKGADAKMTETSQIAVLKGYEKSNTVLEFQQVFKDGTQIEFEGNIAIKIDAGSLNSAIGYTMTVGLAGEPTYTWATA